MFNNNKIKELEERITKLEEVINQPRGNIITFYIGEKELDGVIDKIYSSGSSGISTFYVRK